MGQIRVQGEYVARICQPEGYKGMDISKSDKFKFLCSEKVNACKNNICWAGRDTEAGLAFSDFLIWLRLGDLHCMSHVVYVFPAPLRCKGFGLKGGFNR